MKEEEDDHGLMNGLTRSLMFRYVFLALVFLGISPQAGVIDWHKDGY